MKTPTLAAALAALAAICTTAAVQAAALTGTFTAVADSDYDLSALGLNDWAYWNTTDNPASGAVSNRKSGGTLISAMSPVGGGSVRGSTSPVRPEYDFLFTNGVSPTNGPIDNVIGLFNTGLDTVGRGVALSVTLPTTDTYTVSVWAAANAGQGAFTASIAGASNWVNNSLVADNNFTSKDSALYTLTVTPDNANDVLSLMLTLAVDSAGQSHVLISGVAVSVVAPITPVPTPAALPAGLALLALAAVRRRRSP